MQYYKSIGIGIAILSKKNCIGIGIGNTFFWQYWYWYCQYFLKVLLTTLLTRRAIKKYIRQNHERQGVTHRIFGSGIWHLAQNIPVRPYLWSLHHNDIAIVTVLLRFRILLHCYRQLSASNVRLDVLRDYLV